MMVKLQYLLRAPAAESVGAFRDRALTVGARIVACCPARLKLTYTAEDPPRFSVMPFRRDRVALVSLWDEAAPEEAAARWNALLQAESAAAGYRVDESVPRAYCRDWPEGQDTPGGSMLTLLHRRAGLTDAEFLRRWHDGHSPLALDVHPLWNYVRNVIAAPVLPGSPPLCGIVEEQCRTRGELLDPVQFFGGWLWMVPNMLRVLTDVRSFLDLAALENYLVTERWFRC
ncbi:MAG TPA: hypothetical protein VMK12_20405 [Anaeromyxobacteraceae bacterium]|nr:hypothetical protein [Anaeromyxobacteraceae bacterium]